jgi:transposase InsO family protein
MRRLDEPGERPLVQTVEPVNRYPDYVRNLVRQLKTLFPTMDSVRMACTCSGVLGCGSARRRCAVSCASAAARHPWSQWRVPWLPQSLPQRWPFCWCVAVLVDQASRACVGFAVFHATPNSTQVQQFLERAIRSSGHTPRYVVTARGRQFRLPQLQTLVSTPRNSSNRRLTC